MSLVELLPVLQALPKDDKLRLMQFLVFELAKEEGITLLELGKTYSLWTPYNAFEAADTLLKALAEEKTSYNG
jgi:hypothetical protein